jgi:hypothetical protein
MGCECPPAATLLSRCELVAALVCAGSGLLEALGVETASRRQGLDELRAQLARQMQQVAGRSSARCGTHVSMFGSLFLCACAAAARDPSMAFCAREWFPQIERGLSEKLALESTTVNAVLDATVQVFHTHAVAVPPPYLRASAAAWAQCLHAGTCVMHAVCFPVLVFVRACTCVFVCVCMRLDGT